MRRRRTVQRKQRSRTYDGIWCVARHLEKAGEETFERALLLVIFLATKVFKSSPEETLKNEEECLKMLDELFGKDKEED